MAKEIPLLTHADVRVFVTERNRLATQCEPLLSEFLAVQEKLDALAQLLPADIVADLIGDPPSFSRLVASLSSNARRGGFASIGTARPKGPRREPLTDAAIRLLALEAGGRTAGWLRGRMRDEPALQSRLATAAAVSTSLLRLVERGELVREGGLYYHPDIYAKIKSGALAEEPIAIASAESFSTVMHAVLRRRGGKFTAAEAIAAAGTNALLAARLEEHPARIYNWLGRELHRKRLMRDGKYYFYPSDGARAPKD